MPTGHGPLWTSPLFCSDETVAVHIRGDYAMLAPKWQTLADGGDGTFSADAPWVLSSDSVNFQANGVAAQNVVVLSSPASAFPGGGHLFAVDSVSGNSVTLRRVGFPLNIGQPPGASGLSTVKFSVPSLGPQIDEATYRLKDRFALDEQIFYRSSAWIYQGTEDAYRCLRDACVFTVIADAYEAESRDQTDSGDFARKARVFAGRRDEALGRVQIRFGPTGASEQSTTFFSTKTSR